jgi:hypothetical protein
MVRLCKTTIMTLRISKVSKERNLTAIAIHSIINPTEEILFLPKILVEITFGKYFYSV